jgi:hypothetical protein
MSTLPARPTSARAAAPAACPRCGATCFYAPPGQGWLDCFTCTPPPDPAADLTIVDLAQTRPRQPLNPPLTHAVADLRYFCGLDFFAGWGGSSEGLVAEFERRRRRFPPLTRLTDIFPLTPADFRMPLRDLFLVSFDRERVWLAPPTAPDYGTALDGWSRISRGAFLPLGVEWRDNRLTFRLDGRAVSFTPACPTGLDSRILRPINRLISPKGMQLVAWPIANRLLVMALTPNEKRQLRQERGWRFLTLAS